MIDITNNYNLLNAFVDSAKMKIFGYIKTGNTIIDTLISTLVIGLFSYYMKYCYDFILNFSFSQIFNRDVLLSLFYKKSSVELEGRKSQVLCVYTTSPVVSSVFSDRFKAIWYHIMENIKDNKSIYAVKEQYCNDVKKSNDIYIVSQTNRFLIDKDIYAISEMEEVENNNKETKMESKIDKIKITLYSYKLGIGELTQYVENITENYLKGIKNSRKNINFIYTLNKTKFEDSSYECWNECKFESVKTFDNTFFDGKDYLLKNLEFFLDNKDWYYEKGRPYTLGIGLHGPPGTGKTSVIKAIANKTKRHIINLSMKIIKTRRQLIDFFFESTYNRNNDYGSITFENKIIVIEDIDCIGDIILDRSKKTSKKEKNFTKNSSSTNINFGDILQSIVEVNDSSNGVVTKPFSTLTDDDSITLDDILNIWDGINETSGRILIISSNHYDKLDPALVRPGRIDVPLELGNASRQTISQIYKHYYNEKICKNVLKQIKEYKHSPAAIINLCSISSNSSEFVKNLLKLK
jgi:AAA+ superfamily predicted ATPase